MRKGYILIEMMFVIFIFGLIIASMDRFFRVIAFEIPKDNRLVKENVVLLSAARYIKADVAAAFDDYCKTDKRGFYAFTGDSKKEGFIYYSFDNGQIIRQEIPDKTVWSIPHGKIEMRVWEKNHKGYAVELITCIEDKDLGHIRKKMANNYVFFAGASQEATE